MRVVVTLAIFRHRDEHLNCSVDVGWIDLSFEGFEELCCFGNQIV